MLGSQYNQIHVFTTSKKDDLFGSIASHYNFRHVTMCPRSFRN